MSLFGWDGAEEADWTSEQKAASQQELLGISLDAHPLELVADKVTAAGAVSIVDAAGQVGQRVTVAGVRQTSHRSKTAKGEAMMFLTLEDLSGMMDVVIFPDVYREAKRFLNSASPFLITGMVEMDELKGEPFLKAEKIIPLE
jgi:DNA polymerase-3 subunit alpha